MAAGVVLATSAEAVTQPSAAALAIARQTLAPGDGWASSGTGTTGGSTADDAHVFVAHNRAELVTALGGNNATNASNPPRRSSSSAAASRATSTTRTTP